MKKGLSILLVLCTLMCMLSTGCGGSGDGEGTTNKPSLSKSTLTKYVNEDALSNTDNITISIGKTEKENEEYILNINAPDLLKDLKTKEDKYGGTSSRLVNDIINLRRFRTPDSFYSVPDFNFNGYGAFEITVRSNSPDVIQGETILEDGVLSLVKDGYYYTIWLKDEDRAISIKVTGKLGEENKIYHLKGDEEHKTLFNMIKEHFTFAKISTKKIEKNGINFTAYDPDTITVLGKSADTKNWVFAGDVLYKQLEANGVSLVTAHCVTSNGQQVAAHCILTDEVAETEQPKAFEICFGSAVETTFDSAQAENEFTIGGIRFRETTEGYSRAFGMGFIVKTSTGAEYVCDVYPRGSIEKNKLDLNAAKGYIEKIIVAK
jgi:hypothetical protein